MRSFVLCIALLGLLTGSSCTTPVDKEAATNQLIGEGILLPGPPDQYGMPSKFYFGPGILTRTSAIQSQKPCEGAIGSILPPLSLDQCVAGVLTLPLLGLQKVATALSYGANDPNEHHVYLTGIEQYWVHQTQNNDCWAATLETARDYLHLRHVSQTELIDSARQVCPMLNTQSHGAEAYQIAYSIASTLRGYDFSRTDPHICGDISCIITALTQGQPVIMLGGGHAVLLVGMDYDVAGTGPNPAVVVEQMFVLDPAAEQPVVSKWSTFSFCKIDVFIAY